MNSSGPSWTVPPRIICKASFSYFIPTVEMDKGPCFLDKGMSRLAVESVKGSVLLVAVSDGAELVIVVATA